MILPVAFFILYETSSFIQNEENNLRFFENRVLRKLLSPKEGEVLDDWRNVLEKFYDFRPSQTEPG
jgi:hypothetical protein